jgi:hypothetical protein
VTGVAHEIIGDAGDRIGHRARAKNLELGHSVRSPLP